MTWLQTFSGHKFDLVKPDPADITLADLSEAISKMCRFSGHCRGFYSVAQHSVSVCNVVLFRWPQCPELLLPALLHDAHEVYWGFGDPIRPAKLLDPHVAEFLKNLAKSIDEVVAEAFGFDPALFEHPAIKHADDTLLATEKRDLMKDSPYEWSPLPPPLWTHIFPKDQLDHVAAKKLFLERFLELRPL